MIPTRTLAAALGLAFAAGCALSPPANESLESARAAFNAAQSDPHVTKFAPEELAQASRTLTQAELRRNQGADARTIEHYAYLAERRARTAQEIALARAADAEVARAGEERSRVILEARAREAEAARARAEVREDQAGREQAAQQARGQQAKLEVELRELRAQPAERGWVLTLGAAPLFDVGKSTLKPGGRHSIEQVAQLMRRFPDRIVLVEGFTDDRGGEAYNQALSEQRAQAVKQAMMQAGVDAARIRTRGYGETFPVASNSSEAGRQLNRRVQVVVMPQDGGPSTGASTGR